LALHLLILSYFWWNGFQEWVYKLMHHLPPRLGLLSRPLLTWTNRSEVIKSFMGLSLTSD
jgi:hypothetical protein